MRVSPEVPEVSISTPDSSPRVKLAQSSSPAGQMLWVWAEPEVIGDACPEESSGS